MSLYPPEIGVGRWPASTAQHVAIVARKSVRYELGLLAGEKPERRRLALLAVQGWVDSRRLLDGVTCDLAPRWQVTKMYYSHGYPEPVAAPIRQAFSSKA